MDPDQAVAAEEGAAAEAPDEEGNADGGGGEVSGEAPEAETQGEKAEEKPVTLGYRTFASGKECFDYFHKLLSKLTPNQDLNEVWHAVCTGRVALSWLSLDRAPPAVLQYCADNLILLLRRTDPEFAFPHIICSLCVVSR